MKHQIVISPFEFAIMQAYDPEEAKNYRAETQEEKQERLKQKAIEFAKQIKVKP